MYNTAQINTTHTITRIQKKALSNLHKKLVRLSKLNDSECGHDFKRISKKQFIKYSQKLN